MFILILLIMLGSITHSNAQTIQPGYGYVDSRIGLNVRSSYSTYSGKVTGLRDNTKVQIDEIIFTTNSSTAKKNIWYHIRYGNKSGYVRSDYIDGVNFAAVTGRTSDYLNCRSGAGTGFSKVTTFGKNVNLTILMNARSSSSNVRWYMIKYNGKYVYVCSSWVNITGSIFSNNSGGTSDNKGISNTQDKNINTKPSSNHSINNENKSNGGTSSNTGQQNTANKGSNSQTQNSTRNDSFEESIKSFPEDYKVKLRELHKIHPAWQFIAKNTGVDWNTALTKESRNGVSLINYVYPLSYRDTSANSFKATDSNRTLYKGPSTSSSTIGTISSNTDFTILDEVFTANKNSDDIKFVHIRTADNKVGYIKNSVTNESYSRSFTGVVSGLTNLRNGSGTAFSWVGSLPDKSKVEIVLSTKAADGIVWYKIKRNNGFAYICGKFVKDLKATESSESTSVNTEVKQESTQTGVSGTAKNDAIYRIGPSDLFSESGKINSGQSVSILSKVINIDNSEWYKIVVNSKIYYVSSSLITINSEVKTDEAIVKGKTTDYLNYRSNYSTGGKPDGMLGKNKEVVIAGAIKSDKYVWYKIKINNKSYYVASNWIKLLDTDYETKAISENVSNSSGNNSENSTDISSLNGTGRFIASGKFIPKDGSTWFNAHPSVVAYYMDPRNFINDNNIYMFEDLSYKPYQSSTAVSKILGGSALARNGFQANWFVGAGQENGISPIALAARARQETGGGSIAISGYRMGADTYYNPYNIGAYSDANPVMRGLEYAKSQGWNTKEKAVYGGAKFIANGYIKRGQNSIYYQRFNVANGIGAVGTHQYMTNITACYTESNTTKSSYASYGITNEALVFEIPIFTNMPASTSLPH